MSRPAPRLKDIAARTGFSINTVSVALRGPSHIPESTRARILDAARALNYVPNAVARSLVNRTTRTVGVVVTNIMNPILSRAAQAIEENLVAAGYGALFSITANDVDKERAAINHLLQRQVDGILIYPANHQKLEPIAELRATGLPVVMLTRPPASGFDIVAVDERTGAELITRHLITLGHRRIGFLDASQTYGSREKYAGYSNALLNADLPADASLVMVPEGNSATHGYRSFPLLMDRAQRPTAVFASTDTLAIGAMHWCRENGVRVPQDCSIVGFDDIESSAFLEVPLTTIGYPADQLGEAAVRRLVEMIEAPRPDGDGNAYLVRPTLVVRNSSSAFQPSRDDRPVLAAISGSVP